MMKKIHHRATENTEGELKSEWKSLLVFGP